LGVVFVLLLGEIDLSVGYVSGVCGVVTALLLLPDHNNWWRFGAFIWPGGDGISGWLVVVLVILLGCAIGAFHGVLIAKLGLPSFVVTLAGLLAWNGVVLIIIGSRGTVVIQNYVIIDVANKYLTDRQGWIFAIIVVGLYAISQLLGVYQRRREGLPAG